MLSGPKRSKAFAQQRRRHAQRAARSLGPLPGTCYVNIALLQGFNSLARTQILFVLTQTIYSFLQGSS
jgi:hypothetical protein